MQAVLKPIFALLCISVGICGTIDAQDTHAEGRQSPSHITPAIQEKHSKHYRLTRLVSGENIDEVITWPDNTNKQEVSVYTHRAEATRVAGPDGYPRIYVSYLVEHSDLIMVGRPIAKASYLTQDHVFVFSDCEFSVDHVLKNDGNLLSDRIIVSRAGGDVQYRGKTIHAIYPGFPPFAVDDAYLLFLKRIPDTGAFKVEAEGTYVLRGGKVLSVIPDRRTDFGDVSSFDDEVNAAISLENSQRGRQ